MGRKPKTEKKIYTEQDIVDVLSTRFLNPSSLQFLIRGLFVFDKTWESDYLGITKSGYLYEGEVKISRGDFNADKKKVRKHQILEGKYTPKKLDVWKNGKYMGQEDEKVLKPHYFFYAVPEGLIKEDEVPDYAGLVYITDVFPYWTWVKKAPKLHDEKYSNEDLNLTEKFYYNMLSWRNKALYDYKRELDEVRQLLTEAKTDENGVKYPMTAGQYKELYENILNEKLELEKKYNENNWEYRCLLHKMNVLTKKLEKYESTE